jgi:hypothetical protein
VPTGIRKLAAKERNDHNRNKETYKEIMLDKREKSYHKERRTKRQEKRKMYIYI